jgi:antitoxin component YwqK of YwqJK toxin-antitoxin module
LQFNLNKLFSDLKKLDSFKRLTVGKKLIILFILFLCVSGINAQTEERALNGPRNVKNKRDELRRRQEVWRTYNIDGDLISEFEYKNDKKEGKCTTFYPGGGEKGEKIKEETQYFDGKKDGPSIKKYLSGQTAEEGEYNLKLRVGKWAFYYEDGQVKTEGEYIAGKKDGEWKTYNRKGVLTKTINYSNVAPAPAPKKADSKKPGGNKPAQKK